MRKVTFLLLVVLCLMCTSCNQIVPSFKEEDRTTDHWTPPITEDMYDVLPDLEYDEAPDSLEGVDANDLSGLKNAVDGIGNNYAAKTKVYFNAVAVERVIYNYKVAFYCQNISLYTDRYIYRYNDGFKANEGYVEHNGSLYSVKLEGITLADKLNSSITEDNLTLYKEETTIEESYFLLGDFDSKYVDDHGPITIKYSNTYSESYDGWSRISSNKYKCDRPDVINDFLKIVSPGFDNGGTYMTFTHVTVETFDDGTIRLRLYASPTQIGKLIDSHLVPEYTNWYLLFAEAYIYDIDNIEPSVFENFYN